MTARMVHDSTTGRLYMLDTTYMKHLTATEAAALSQDGYTYKSYPTATLQALATAHGIPASSIPSGNGTYSIAQAVPVTVQGASEQFFIDKLAQVNVHTTTVANTLNGFNATYRNEIRTHVTAEADRVIASE